MGLRHVRNDSGVERVWGTLVVEDDELGHAHSLSLADGAEAHVELPDDFTDPHLVEIDDNGEVVPWPEPEPEDSSEPTPESSPTGDSPPAGTSSSPGANPPPTTPPVTVPVPPVMSAPSSQQDETPAPDHSEA